MNHQKFKHQIAKSLALLSKNKFSRGRIQIFEGNRQSISGIRATIFGATGFLGPYVGAILGYIGSDIIYPYNHRYPYDDEVKELKLTGAIGHTALIREMDFDDHNMIDRVIKDSNVVINLCGPRRWVKDYEDAEDANLTTARNIAKACARNEGVKRLIQFSSCGVSEDSPSVDFKTKAIAEKEVLEIFPDATIFRPTTVYGMNDYFSRHWLTEREYFYHFNLVTDDCKAKRQPIFVNDVAQCILNSLKLPEESCGQIFELGGPHQYTRLECYEVFHNIVGKPPKLVHVPQQIALTVTDWMNNWEYLSKERVIKDELDIVVSGNHKTIKDLYVQPVGFPQGMENLLNDLHAKKPESRDFNER